MGLNSFCFLATFLINYHIYLYRVYLTTRNGLPISLELKIHLWIILLRLVFMQGTECNSSIFFCLVFTLKNCRISELKAPYLSCTHLPITFYVLHFRIGLVGNPSDGYYGKTISMTISNFWADVTITESEKLVIIQLKLRLYSSIFFRRFVLQWRREINRSVKYAPATSILAFPKHWKFSIWVKNLQSNAATETEFRRCSIPIANLYCNHLHKHIRLFTF